jgi:hypothetical protein
MVSQIYQPKFFFANCLKRLLLNKMATVINPAESQIATRGICHKMAMSEKSLSNKVNSRSVVVIKVLEKKAISAITLLHKNFLLFHCIVMYSPSMAAGTIAIEKEIEIKVLANKKGDISFKFIAIEDIMSNVNPHVRNIIIMTLLEIIIWYFCGIFSSSKFYHLHTLV